MRWTWHVACIGEIRNVQDFGEDTEEKRQLGKPRRRWENNIKMDLQEVGWGMDWMDLARNMDRCFCEYGNEPSGSIKCEGFLE